MKTFWSVLIAVTMGLLLNSHVAEAKRMGGGGSFGSKPSYNQPMQRDNAAPSKQQSAPQNNGAAPASATPSAAPRSGMGGMLGGLLAGGLLGALLFGGAFENLNFADIAIFALIAFVAFKLVKHFRMSRAPQTAPAGGAPHSQAYDDSVVARRESTPHSAAATPRYAGAGSATPSTAVNRRALSLPPNFNESEFLAEAKNKYTLLQDAWDKGELGTLRQFSTDKVFGEVQDMYRARQGENRTELQRVDATLIDIADHSDAIEASVLFDVTMVEHDANSPLLPQPKEVSEVWHFIRSKRAMRPEWMLDGIQQVE